MTFKQLNDPLLSLARQEIAHSPHAYALVVHDWSRLAFYSHQSKAHRLKMTHSTDVGYELRSSLLVDAASGLTIAPLAQTLSDNTGCHSTLADDLLPRETHLDALTADILKLEKLGIEKKLVHIIDREGDSIGHMRPLSAQGLHWLIRGKEGHRVEHLGTTKKLGEVADGLTFRVSGEVDYKGKKAGIAVSEARITITRAAKPKQVCEVTGKRIPVQKGEALAVRLIAVQLTDKQGNVLGRWTLLTNVAEEVSREEVAQWYYWRWSIESFFKLIKGAGYALESWLQRSAEAVLRRLLIVSMACVLTWRLQRGTSAEGVRARQLVCRLSGRQQKRGRRESAPALLAGLSILLNTLQLLTEYTPEELTQLAASALGQFRDV